MTAQHQQEDDRRPPMTELVNAPMPVTPHTIEHFLAMMLRNEQLFQLGVAHLDPKMFRRSGEAAYSVIWQTAYEFYERYRKLPTYDGISSLAVARAGQFVDSVAPDPVAVDSILRYLFEGGAEPSDLSLAEDYFRQFLFDRMVGDKLAIAVERRVGGAGIDVPKLLEEIEATNRTIGSVARVRETRLTVGLRDAPVLQRTPTGVPVFDRLMVGGTVPRETYVILGPTGVAKTLSCVQLGVAHARAQVLRKAQGLPTTICGYVSYEASRHELAIRAISNAAYIDKGRLEQNMHELSTRDSLQPYEQEMYALCQGDDLFVLGEQERMAEVEPWLDEYFRVIDFSGCEGSAGGYGGIPEARAALDRLRHDTGQEIGLVINDWAGMAVRRKLRTGGLDNIALELVDYVTQCNDTISMYFNCPTFIAHQLAGKCLKMPPTSLPHHSDADWCKSFAFNATYAICIGMKDEKSQACLVGATKTRRSEGAPAFICRINGKFSELLIADEELKIDRATRRIVAQRNAVSFVDTVRQRSDRCIRLLGDMDMG
jgi:hypothetical protein